VRKPGRDYTLVHMAREPVHYMRLDARATGVEVGTLVRKVVTAHENSCRRRQGWEARLGCERALMSFALQT
jgi:hypothetical protein